MKLKLNFEVVTVEIKDMKFFAKEMDFAELYQKHSKFTMRDGKAVIDTDLIGAVNDFCLNSITGWENLQDENGNVVLFNRDTILKLPYTIRQEIYNKVSEKSNLSEEEKNA
jgi:hypothetical protein